MRYLYIFLSLLSLSLFGALTGAPQAQAVSEYEDNIPKTQTLEITSPDRTQTLDLTENSTTSVYSILNNVDNIAPNFCNNPYNNGYSSQCGYSLSVILDNLNNYPDRMIAYSEIELVEDFNPAWGQTNGMKLVQIVTTAYDNPYSLLVSNLSGIAHAEFVDGGNPISLTIALYNTGEIRFGGANTGSGGTGINTNFPAGAFVNSQPNIVKLYYAKNFTHITYGSNWNGSTNDLENIPNSPPTPTQTISTGPDWYISEIIDWKGTFHDSNFNTFDGNPFLCDDEFAPVLHWELWLDPHGGPQTLKASGVQSATAEINHQFEKVDIISRYEIVGWYECPGYEFPNQGRKKFEIGRNGLIEENLFETCFDVTNFMFFNPENCLSNVYTVINLLSFNQISLGNVWELSDGCRNLGVVGDWLFTPNYRICPQFPAEIRNIITPFITVALGLLTISFIARKREE